MTDPVSVQRCPVEPMPSGLRERVAKILAPTVALVVAERLEREREEAAS